MTKFDWFRPMVRFVVVRGTGSPEDGMWYERERIPTWSVVPATLTLHATGRYERRDDGLLAEVYEPDPANDVPA